jgi:hypothetical protein
MAKVRDAVGDDASSLVEALQAIALGKTDDLTRIFGEDRKPTYRERQEAIKELLDRGWGKAPATLAIETTPPLMVVDHLTPDDVAEQQRERDA